MSFYSINELNLLGLAGFGSDVFISRKVSLYHPERILIGNHVRIDDYCVLSAGEGGIEIGNYVHIAIFCSLIGACKIVLSDFTCLSSRVSIYSSNDDYSGKHMTNPTVPKAFTDVTHADVMLKKHAIIGSGAVILPGVTIGEGAVIGALSLAKKDCPPFTICSGVPARQKGKRQRDLLNLEKQLLQQTSVSLQQLSETLKVAIGCYLDNKVDLAWALFEEILTADPNNITALNYTALICKQRGDYEQAIERTRTIAAIRRHHLVFHELGLLFMIKNEVEQAYEQFEEAVRLQNDFIPARFQIAKIMLMRGKISCGYNKLVEILQIDDTYKPAIDIVIQIARESLAMDPKNCRAQYILGNALASIGEFTEALEVFREAIRLEPGNIDAASRVHQILHKMEKHDEADREYRIAIEIDLFKNSAESIA